MSMWVFVDEKRLCSLATLRWGELPGSLWLGAGADPKVVQRILGHASAAMATGAPTPLRPGNDEAPGEVLGL